LHAPATRVAQALARRGAATRVSGGVRDLTVLKTTQSGYEGFLRDELTTLPETRERMLATSITASWEYTQAPADCDAAFASLQAALCGAFFGPASGGVYSPSVQMTLYQMGAAALAAVRAMGAPAPEVEVSVEKKYFPQAKDERGLMEAVFTARAVGRP